MAEKITSIEYFYFQIGGYFDGYRQIKIQDNYFKLKETQYEIPVNILDDDNHLCQNSINQLIDVLNEISLTSWAEGYNNNEVMDGIQWEIEIKFNNHKKSLKSYVSNAYPFFDKNNNTISSRSLDITPDFIRLTKILNNLINKKNYFY